MPVFSVLDPTPPYTHFDQPVEVTSAAGNTWPFQKCPTRAQGQLCSLELMTKQEVTLPGYLTQISCVALVPHIGILLKNFKILQTVFT